LYDIKNGVEYAKLCQSIRHGSKVDKTSVNLGKVLDKERGIYKNRERGVFIYDLNTNVYRLPEQEYMLPAVAPKPPKLNLDFGDVFFLSTYLQLEKLTDCLDAIGYKNRDTIYAMLCYYILCATANCYAEDWYYGSYASIIYPKANLVSQRISEFLFDIGQERSLRNFFSEYIHYISNSVKKGSNILIDSTGLPNSIHFPLTAISNHNGEISSEVRLIYY
jgi:hypothetical protein